MGWGIGVRGLGRERERKKKEWTKIKLQKMHRMAYGSLMAHKKTDARSVVLCFSLSEVEVKMIKIDTTPLRGRRAVGIG